jgi:hypothetical protein
MKSKSLLPRASFIAGQSYVYREVGCWYNRKERVGLVESKEIIEVS